MKRSVICICVLLLAAGCIFAFSATTDSAAPGQAAQLPKGTKDLTVLPEFIYNPESIATGTVLEIVDFNRPEDADDAEERAAEAVIEGSVKAVYYTFIEGSAWTQADIYISRSVLGGLSKGCTVSVYFAGGYVSSEDYSAYYGESPAWKNSFLFFEGEELPLPQSGDRGTYCLALPAPEMRLPEGAYMAVK